MSGPRPADLLRQLVADEVSDRDLLRRFAATRDGDAFAELVRRHGPVVLAASRRGVGNYHDADDVFQAVFLILARRAGSIRPPELLGNWLYGVAVGVARNARRAAARRRVREVQGVDAPEPVAPPTTTLHDLGPVLDEELGALPAWYRDAIILCDLRGVSRADAAAALGIPLGTLASRLDNARKKLAARLVRRGVTLSVGAVLVEARAVAVPGVLLAKTSEVVAVWSGGGALPPALVKLAQGGLAVRLTMVLGLVTAAVTTVVGIGLAARTPQDPPPPAQPAPPAPLAVAAPDPAAEARAAVGEYGRNLRAFTRYRCEFTTRRGTAATTADARAGRLNVDIEGNSTLTVDGPRVRLDNHGTPVSKGLAGKKAEPIPGTDLGKVGVDFFEEDVYLTNGTEELHANDLGINVYTPDLPASPSVPHPLTTGLFDFRLRAAPDRLAGRPDEYNLSGEGRHTLDGRATVRVRLAARTGVSAYLVDLDPARGHLPYRGQRLDRADGAKDGLRLTTEAWVLEAKDCGSGRFFPSRVVSVTPLEDGSPKVFVEETVVKSVDTDHRPAADAFNYRLPGPAHVVYGRRTVYASLTLGKDDVITPGSLPELVNRLKARLPKGAE